MAETTEHWNALHEAAYEAFRRGALTESIPSFEALAEAFPEKHFYQYMLGLAHKYRRDWAASLRHSLKAIQEGEDDQQAEHWNAAIAATGLGDWAQARRQWQLCGLEVDAGDEPIDEDWGKCCVRLNPWGSGETVYARRINPAVAVLKNVPFAHSGYRFGDHVMVDGAKTGERTSGELTVPVFNALQRLQASAFKTYVVALQCGNEADANDIEDAEGSGIGLVEDWTRTVRYLCLKCSYGEPHTHDDEPSGPDAWRTERSFGIAALSRSDVDAFLDSWLARGSRKGKIAKLFDRRPSRLVLEVDDTDHEIPEPGEDHVWWESPDE